jgi:hypothetical protein
VTDVRFFAEASSCQRFRGGKRLPPSPNTCTDHDWEGVSLTRPVARGNISRPRFRGRKRLRPRADREITQPPVFTTIFICLFGSFSQVFSYLCRSPCWGGRNYPVKLLRHKDNGRHQGLPRTAELIWSREKDQRAWCIDATTHRACPIYVLILITVSLFTFFQATVIAESINPCRGRGSLPECS